MTLDRIRSALTASPALSTASFATAAGLGLGIAFAGSATEGPQRENAATWTLPSALALRRANAADFERARVSPVWQDHGVARQPPGATTVRLVGIVQSGDGLMALFASSESSSLVRLGVGGTLTDGSEVVSVTTEQVRLRKAQCERVLHLYRPAEPAAVCE